MKKISLLAAAIAALICARPLSASLTYEWTASSGDWYTSTNWSPNIPAPFDSTFFTTPGRDAEISSGTATDTGGDILIGGGNTITINGGNVVQPSGHNYAVQIGGSGIGTGTLKVTAGSLDVGSGYVLGTPIVSGGLLKASILSGGISMSGGTINLDTMENRSGSLMVGGAATLGALSNYAAFSMTGGTLNVTSMFYNTTGGSVALAGNASVTTGEFRLMTTNNLTIGGTASFTIGGDFLLGSGTMSMSGGTVHSGGMFNFGSSQKFTLYGGAITIDSSLFGGIFNNAGGYINIPSLGTSGSVLLSSVSNGESDILSGKIRFKDTILTAGNYLSYFNVTHPTLGSTLITVAVPEPSTYAAALGGACVGMCLLRRRR